MKSLYDELSAKLEKEPGFAKRGGARADIGLILFGAKNDLRDLWRAADACLRSRDEETFRGLKEAVDKLHPIFGERNGPATSG